MHEPPWIYPYCSIFSLQQDIPPPPFIYLGRHKKCFFKFSWKGGGGKIKEIHLPRKSPKQPKLHQKLPWSPTEKQSAPSLLQTFVQEKFSHQDTSTTLKTKRNLKRKEEITQTLTKNFRMLRVPLRIKLKNRQSCLLLRTMRCKIDCSWYYSWKLHKIVHKIYIFTSKTQLAFCLVNL